MADAKTTAAGAYWLNGQFLLWVGKFQANVGQNPTARRACEELWRAGLSRITVYCLYLYSLKPRDHAWEVKRRIRAAIRALEVARTRAPQRAREPGLFRKRAAGKVAEALAASLPQEPGDEVWFAPGEQITVGDVYRRLGGTDDDREKLASASKAVTRLLGARSAFTSPFFHLIHLRQVAEERGVKLGWKRMASLATCADPSRTLFDDKALRRYARPLLGQR
ncbi:MAG: hypothetical protein WBC67_02455 [Candidatus Acidiferrales bacterium]